MNIIKVYESSALSLTPLLSSLAVDPAYQMIHPPIQYLSLQFYFFLFIIFRTWEWHEGIQLRSFVGLIPYLTCFQLLAYWVCPSLPLPLDYIYSNFH